MSDPDVLVIGAGPAGAVAATLLARRGLAVRLVDKKPFPRRKVCGACLSGYAVSALDAAGLGHVLAELGAVPLASFRLASNGRSAAVPLRGGCVLSRRALDAALVAAAVSAGATVDDGVAAEVGPCEGDARTVSLRRGQVGKAIRDVPPEEPARVAGPEGEARGPEGKADTQDETRGTSSLRGHALRGLGPATRVETASHWRSQWHCRSVLDGAGSLPGNAAFQTRDEIVRAKAVLVAAGLAGAVFRHEPELRSIPIEGARVGAGAEMTDVSDFYAPGTIFMTAGRAGYVGLVRTETGSLNVAAALDPRFVAAEGGPGPAASAIVRHAGLPAEGLAGVDWTGTPLLTRRPAALASDRVFLVGDAAGYVEPFTGEGIGWAIGGTFTVVPLVARAVESWSSAIGKEWTATHARTIGRRQRLCRVIAAGLRSPVAVTAATRLLAPFPWAASPVLRHLAAT